MLRHIFTVTALSLSVACSHAEAVVDEEGSAGAGGTAGAGGAAAGSGGSTGGKAGSGGSSAGAGGAAAGAGGTAAGAGGAAAGSAGTAGTAGAAGSTSTTNHLVINEVASTGASADDEYVEIYNPTSKSVSLDGWELKYASSSGDPMSTWTGGAGDSVPSNGYFVVAGAKFSGSSDGALSLAMGASGGGIGLFDGSKQVDSVAWNDNNKLAEGTGLTGPHADGASYSRIPDGVDTDDNSVDLKEGARTPGAANSL